MDAVDLVSFLENIPLILFLAFLAVILLTVLINRITSKIHDRWKSKYISQIRKELQEQWVETCTQEIKTKLQADYEKERQTWYRQRDHKNAQYLAEMEETYKQLSHDYFKDLYTSEINKMRILINQAAIDRLKSDRAQLEQDKIDFNDMRRAFLDERKESTAKIKEQLREFFLERYRQGFEKQTQSYPWLAQQYADFLYIYDEKTAEELVRKSRPALRAAEEVRRIAGEKRDLQKQLKSAQYQLNYYETLFPWLEDFKELDPHEGAALVMGAEDSDEYVSYHEWLSPEEYQELPDVEKFQLALDRYVRKHKTNWQAGIEYERYVGYRFEQMGYTVQYTGALEKLEDMGRDLIAQKKGGTYIIQCKRWATEKTIHEKHVFQLFGSYVHYQIETDERNIHCALYTTAQLSDTAQKAADMLDIAVSIFPMKEYPLVKCHIADNGEKIYHLPFDLQYDRIRNRQNGRLIYVDTVKEAENLGYRRAYRWRGGHSS